MEATPAHPITASPLPVVVSELPPKSRETVVAVDLLGLSYPQAGRALGIPTGTVKSRLFGARARLASRIGEPGCPAEGKHEHRREGESR